MPNPLNRESLSKNLEDRYMTQRAGGAFQVKDILQAPGKVPASGTTIDAANAKGQEFQSPNGFLVKPKPGNDSQFKDAQGRSSKELSIHLKGFSNRKYKP